MPAKGTKRKVDAAEDVIEVAPKKMTKKDASIKKSVSIEHCKSWYVHLFTL